MPLFSPQIGWMVQIDLVHSLVGFTRAHSSCLVGLGLSCDRSEVACLRFLNRAHPVNMSLVEYLSEKIYEVEHPLQASGERESSLDSAMAGPRSGPDGRRLAAVRASAHLAIEPELAAVGALWRAGGGGAGSGRGGDEAQPRRRLLASRRRLGGQFDELNAILRDVVIAVPDPDEFTATKILWSDLKIKLSKIVIGQMCVHSPPAAVPSLLFAVF